MNWQRVKAGLAMVVIILALMVAFLSFAIIGYFI